MSAIEIEGLTKRFGDLVAVDGLTFAVEAGTVTGFLGPNGAGKTTTLRMLLGLVTPTAGTATIGGVPYRELSHPVRTVGAVLEASGFHPKRRALDHLRVLATAAGIGRARVDEVLERVELTHAARRPVGGFSLGMRQRLALAVALLGDPRVLILDEPTNGLDPEGVHWLRSSLRAYAAGGGTVIVSSHLLAEVAQTVDDVVIVAKGRLVATSSLEALTQQAMAVVRIRTPHADALRQALQAKGVTAEQRDDETIVAVDAEAEQVGLIAAGAGIVIYELAAEHLGLEDVFLDLTSSGTATADTADTAAQEPSR